MSTIPAIPSPPELATSGSPLPAPNSPLRRGRPRALHHFKTRQVIHLISRGCSLKEAARHVGCATSTIRREARRDPDFGSKLRQAIVDTELAVLNSVRQAAHSHWRAGRWLLERAAAQRAREQNGQPLTPRRLRRFTAAITAVLKSEIQDDAECQRLTMRLIEVIRETNRNLANTPPKKSRRQARRDTHTNERAEDDSPTLEQATRQNASANDLTGRQTGTTISEYGKITHYSSFADAARAASNIQQQPSDGAQQ